MSYVDGIVDYCWDEQASQDEAAAQHQMALDVLYRVGCQYNVKDADMVNLCQLANVNFNELQNHSYKLNESTTPCQSPLLSSATPVLANQQAFAT